MSTVVHEYALVMFGGHLIIHHDGQALLLDTGSPVSMGRQSPCRFLGQEFPVQLQYNGVTTEELSENIGTRIDVLLGCDVLARFAVTIDTETARVVFDESTALHGARVLPLETIGGIPVVEVGLAGKPLRTLVHTGATVSGLRGADTRPYPFVGIARYFYPGLGEFATEVRRVPLTFGDQTVGVVCGTLPPILERTLVRAGVHGIVGSNLLRSFKVGWGPGFRELRLLARRVSAGPAEQLVVPVESRPTVLPTG